jgi:hypothetical protein
VPLLIIVSRIPGHEAIGMELANPADQVLDHSLAIFEFEEPVIIA